MGAPSSDQGRLLTGRDVWQEWCAGMLAQNRVVAPERRNYATISPADQELDEGIAQRLGALARARTEARDQDLTAQLEEQAASREAALVGDAGIVIGQWKQPIDQGTLSEMVLRMGPAIRTLEETISNLSQATKDHDAREQAKGVEAAGIERLAEGYFAARGVPIPRITTGEKAIEEARELVEALGRKSPTQIRHEVADLALVCAVVARQFGTTVADCIAEKIAADTGRGPGDHFQPDDPALLSPSTQPPGE